MPAVAANGLIRAESIDLQGADGGVAMIHVLVFLTEKTLMNTPDGYRLDW
jgi:hypothetical protein